MRLMAPNYDGTFGANARRRQCQCRTLLGFSLECKRLIILVDITIALGIFLIMHDNARPHVVRLESESLHEEQIGKVKQPANSPNNLMD